MATNKDLSFLELPIDNNDIYITEVPKGVTDAMAKFIFPKIEEFYKDKESKE